MPQMIALRLAIALARTRPGAARTIEEIAEDARALAKIGRSARGALERQRPADKFEAAAEEILSRYGAEAVRQRDVAGCVLGARFRDGPRRGFQNIFFIS